MERHQRSNEQPQGSCLYVNLMDDGQNIFTVIALAEEVLVGIGKKIMRGEQVRTREGLYV